MNPELLPLLVDCDNVLSDFTGACLKLAADKFNIFAQPEDCTEDDIWNSIGCPYLPPAIDEETMRREFCYKMKPIAAGIQMLRTLEETYGVENVFICTTPWASDKRETATGEWASQRYAWLRDIAKVPRKRVIQCSAKNLIPGVLIDDRMKNLEGRDPMQAFCIAHPYNKEFNGPRGGYQDCLNWLTMEWYDEGHLTDKDWR